MDVAKGNDRKGAVLLQHGLLDSAATWLLNPKDRSLGYILADRGYDVWLSNSRGNTYARRHKELSPNDSRFWNFTWVEMALYDIPSVVDYVLAKTGSKSIIYIGHSQGTRIVFAFLSGNREYQSKIKTIFALAPPTFLSDVRTPIRHLAPVSKHLLGLIGFFAGQEFLPLTGFTKFMGRTVCKYKPSLCMKIITLLTGGNSAHTNTGMQSHRFCQFDYGRKRNQEAYGHIYPPDFDLTRVKVPTYIFNGGADWMAGPKDVDQTVRELGLAVKGRFTQPTYNHLDFIWAYDAARFIYKEILASL